MKNLNMYTSFSSFDSGRVTSILRYIGFALIGLTATPVIAEDAEVERTPSEVESRTYFFEKAGKEMEYALYVPNGYDKSKYYPLLVLLHAMRSDPQAVMRYEGIIQEADARGYIVVAPYGYNERGWYGSRGPRRGQFTGRGIGRGRGNRRGREDYIAPSFGGQFFGREGDPVNLGELSELDVLNVLEIAKKEFRIDNRRIYLMGHAMGGGGTLHLGVTHPKIWAGLAALAPSFYADPKVLHQSRNIPTIIVIGDEDAIVSVDRIRPLVAQMEKSKTDYRYIEIAGGDHYLSIAQNPELISKVFEFFEGKLPPDVTKPKPLGEVYRKFTNNAGNSIEAYIITASDEKVTIKRKDGKRFELALSSLSDEDQAYIGDWIGRNAEKISREAFRAAMETEPDPDLEAKLIERLNIDLSAPETAIELISIEIEEKEKEINALDGKIKTAIRGRKTNAIRNLQIEAVGLQEELITLRALRADLEKNID
jgi:poly(3-hydroxybutyrate) depolymerase